MIARPPGRSSALLAYLADVIRHDSSLIVRRHVARALSEGMIMSLAFGDVHGTLTSGVDEASEDNSASRDKREFQIVKALRKDFGKQAMLMDTLQAEFM
jgi:transcription initiation factor TFIID subunit 2